jgi:hypothetical protein
MRSGPAWARGSFQESEWERLVSEHLEGGADHAFPLRCLLMLELWHREVLEAGPQRPAGRHSPTPLSDSMSVS